MKHIKVLIFVFSLVLFFGLFITDNRLFNSLTHLIEHDIIKPYSRQNESDEEEDNQEKFARPTITETVTKDQIASPSAEPTVKVVYITPTPLDTVTEEKLWQALTTYRSSHGKPDLQKSDSLCTYARERVQEHITRLEEDPEQPLDGHSGFERDADSGKLFDVTGFSMVGENLAYTPNYSSATQIIEWGWDTSAGHKELQLSTDISHACISGQYPIYVGIFGK